LIEIISLIIYYSFFTFHCIEQFLKPILCLRMRRNWFCIIECFNFYWLNYPSWCYTYLFSIWFSRFSSRFGDFNRLRKMWSVSFQVNNEKNERGCISSARKRDGWAQMGFTSRNSGLFPLCNLERDQWRKVIVPIFREILTRESNAVDLSRNFPWNGRMLLFVGGPRQTGQTVPRVLGWLPICRRSVHLP